MPLITDWHNDNAIHREVFVNVAGAAEGGLLHVIPVVIAWGAFRFADRMKNWERGRPAPTPPHDGEERQAPLRRLPGRRVHAHAAA